MSKENILNIFFESLYENNTFSSANTEEDEIDLDM